MKNLSITIVGCGPRGLASLESLVKKLNDNGVLSNTQISVFEPFKFPGSGPVWDVNQSSENWMNIDDKALDKLSGREAIKHSEFYISEFPSFSKWIKKHNIYTAKNKAELIFYPRSVLGDYLLERYQSLTSPLKTHINFKLINKRIDKIAVESNTIMLLDEDNKKYITDECLITIGHQDTELGYELKKWQAFTKKNDFSLVLNPYEENLSHYLKHKSTIAIRGFGLAMIDIMRVLVKSDNTDFLSKKDSVFLTVHNSNKKVRTIVPYSLNGLPPSPKPYSHTVDMHFKPSDEQIETFEEDLKALIFKPEKLEDTQFLIHLFSDLVLNIIIKNLETFKINNLKENEIKDLIISWLSDMSTKSELILDTEMNTLDYMKQLALMSYGKIKFSLDYTIGQIWRHTQPTLYKVFAFSELEDELMGKIIALDSSTKRYSYGPPVASILQLIALAEADIINLNFLKNPDISIDDDGWTLKYNTHTINCDVMINSVLDPPVLEDIKSKLIVSLLKDDLIKPVTSKLGIETLKDSTVVSQHDNNIKNLAIFGRICKGSIVGSDAILECFNEHSNFWASGVFKRHFKELDSLQPPHH